MRKYRMASNKNQNSGNNTPSSNQHNSRSAPHVEPYPPDNRVMQLRRLVESILSHQRWQPAAKKPRLAGGNVQGPRVRGVSPPVMGLHQRRRPLVAPAVGNTP